jgi:hypothetical protein
MRFGAILHDQAAESQAVTGQSETSTQDKTGHGQTDHQQQPPKTDNDNGEDINDSKKPAKDDDAEISRIRGESKMHACFDLAN